MDKCYTNFTKLTCMDGDKLRWLYQYPETMDSGYEFDVFCSCPECNMHRDIHELPPYPEPVNPPTHDFYDGVAPKPRNRRHVDSFFDDKENMKTPAFLNAVSRTVQELDVLIAKDLWDSVGSDVVRETLGQEYADRLFDYYGELSLIEKKLWDKASGEYSKAVAKSIDKKIVDQYIAFSKAVDEASLPLSEKYPTIFGKKSKKSKKKAKKKVKKQITVEAGPFTGYLLTTKTGQLVIRVPFCDTASANDVLKGWVKNGIPKITIMGKGKDDDSEVA